MPKISSKKRTPDFTIGTSYGKGGKAIMQLPETKLSKKQQFRSDVASGKYDKVSANLKTGSQISKAKTATAISQISGVSKRQKRLAAQDKLGINKREYKTLTRSSAPSTKKGKIMGRAGTGVNLCKSGKCY
jgi:hypothetical protein